MNKRPFSQKDGKKGTRRVGGQFWNDKKNTAGISRKLQKSTHETADAVKPNTR